MRYQTPLYLVSFIASWLTIYPCYGETAVEDDVFSLSLEELLDIKVTVASLFPETQLEAASTVSVITEEDWKQRGARRTSDAVGNQPGVMLYPMANADSMAIRGYAQPVLHAGIASLLDGVPLNTLSFGAAFIIVPNFNLGALDSIEMVRGTGSAVHGADAFHGVYSLNSFYRDEDIRQYSLEYGSNGYFQGSTKLSEALNTNWRTNIALAASGQPNQDANYNYIDISTGEKEKGDLDYNYDSQTAVFKLLSTNSFTRKYQLSIYYDKHDTEDFSGIGQVFFGGPTEFGHRDTYDTDSIFYMAKAGVTQFLAKQFSLEGSAYYFSSDFDAVIPTVSPFTHNFVEIDESHFGGALILRQEENMWRTRWLASLSYKKGNMDKSTVESFLPSGDSVLAISGEQGFDRSVGSLVFSAKTALKPDMWDITYGVRLDDYSDFGLEASPRFSLIYRPQSDLAIKLNYGEAFRAPTAFESVDGNPGTSFAIKGGVDPEQMESTELVLMKHAQNWKVELVLYESQWKDGIVTVSSTDPRFFAETVNQAKNSAKGLEAIYQWRGRKWLIDSSASYVSSTNDSTGFDYDAFPRIILNLGLGYTLKNEKTKFYLNNRVHYKVKEAPPSAAFPAEEQLPHYWRADLNVSHQYNVGLELFCSIRNIFDRDNRFPSLFAIEDGTEDDPFSLSIGFRYSEP